MAIFGVSTVYSVTCYEAALPPECGSDPGDPYPQCRRVKVDGGKLGQVDNEDGPNINDGPCGKIWAGFQQPTSMLCGHDWATEDADCPPEDEEEGNET